jgi:hypothetical protein
MLLRRLDALNALTGPSYQTMKPSQYADSQIILDHPQPQNSGECFLGGEVNLEEMPAMSQTPSGTDSSP